jgi:hypothetical protein
VHIVVAGAAAEVGKSECHLGIELSGLRFPVTGITVRLSMRSCERETALFVIINGKIRRTKAGNGVTRLASPSVSSLCEFSPVWVAMAVCTSSER